jgi:hypothetical protein
MTNGEKYKTIEERSKAFNEFCTASANCKRCPIKPPVESGLHSAFTCAFTWLENDTQLSADEVADILNKYSDLSNYGAPEELSNAIARAVELLKEKNNDQRRKIQNHRRTVKSIS